MPLLARSITGCDAAHGGLAPYLQQQPIPSPWQHVSKGVAGQEAAPQAQSQASQEASTQPPAPQAAAAGAAACQGYVWEER
jgi:hypothetical protein